MKNKAGMFGKFFRWFNPAGTQPAECNNTARDTIDCVPAPVHVGQAAHTITATKRTMRRTPLCAALLSVFLLFANGLFTNGWAQWTPNADALDAKITKGTVSWAIEKKTITPAQAAAYIASGEQIPLRVSLRFTGDWVTKLKNSQTPVLTNFCQFSYGIAKSEGTNSTDAPLYTNDPPAYIPGSRNLSCTHTVPRVDPFITTENVVYDNPNWENYCPVYNFGMVPDPGKSLKTAMREVSENGEAVIYVDLWHIFFVLKRAETVYVRGVNKNKTFPSLSTDNDETGTSSMACQLNLKLDAMNVYWAETFFSGNKYTNVGGNNSGANYDWGLAPSTMYKGVIPGGIFIATGPEVTPLVTFLV